MPRACRACGPVSWKGGRGHETLAISGQNPTCAGFQASGNISRARCCGGLICSVALLGCKLFLLLHRIPAREFHRRGLQVGNLFLQSNPPSPSTALCGSNPLPQARSPHSNGCLPASRARSKSRPPSGWGRPRPQHFSQSAYHAGTTPSPPHSTLQVVVVPGCAQLLPQQRLLLILARVKPELNQFGLHGDARDAQPACGLGLVALRLLNRPRE